jgi:ammonia channel protein AmtB
VAITPAAGFVEPWAAILIGLVAGAVCYLAVQLKSRTGFDDSLDVVGVHLVGGLIGALLTGVLASTAVNAVEGGLAQLGKQAIAAGITLAFSFVATLAILKVVDLVFGVRVTEEEEESGLDLSQHAESAYTSDPGGATKALTQDDVDRLVNELIEAARTADLAESRIVVIPKGAAVTSTQDGSSSD